MAFDKVVKRSASIDRVDISAHRTSDSRRKKQFHVSGKPRTVKLQGGGFPRRRKTSPRIKICAHLARVPPLETAALVRIAASCSLTRPDRGSSPGVTVHRKVTSPLRRSAGCHPRQGMSPDEHLRLFADEPLRIDLTSMGYSVSTYLTPPRSMTPSLSVRQKSFS